MEKEWEDRSKNTVIIIKKRKAERDTVCGIIQTVKGGILAEIKAPTITHVKKLLRKSETVPKNIVIGDRATYFNRIKKPR